MKRVSVLKRTWNLSVVLQIVQKIPENYYPYIYQLTKFGGSMSSGSKDVFKNALLSYAIIIIMGSEIWQIMG